MKRVLCAFLSVIMIASAFFCVDLSALAANVNVTNRAEWLKKLVETFNMTVESDEYPDNYFSDLTEDSEYYQDVLIATEFGLVNVEAGNPVDPDGKITREFAAQTLNFCLGFELDKESSDFEYSFADYEDCMYPDDDQIAVNRGWFVLDENGNFCPDVEVTSSEITFMISDANSVLGKDEVDENYDSEYIFADYVVEVPNGTDITIDEYDTVQIQDSPVAISVGDTFVVYINDLPFLYVAETVKMQDNITIITTSEADASSAILDMDMQEVTTVDAEMIEPAEGLEVEEEPSVQTFSRAKNVTITDNSVTLNGKISVGGTSIGLSAVISNIKIQTKANTTTGEFVAVLSFDAALATDVSVNVSNIDIPLGTVNVLGIGSVGLYININVNGKASITQKYDSSVGFSYSVIDGLRNISSFVKKDFSVVLQVSGNVGLKVSANINLLIMNAEVYVSVGLKIEVVSKTYSNDNPKKCDTIQAYLYGTAGYNISIRAAMFTYIKSSTWNFLTLENSPVRLYYHFEDGVKVDKCIRGNDFIYSTPSNSIYGAVDEEYFHNNAFLSDVKLTYQIELDDLKYTIIDGKAIITDFLGFPNEYEYAAIPSKILGYPVTEIGERAFENSSFESIIIPKSVTKLNDFCFYGSKSLQKIVILNDAIEFGSSVFGWQMGNADQSIENIPIYCNPNSTSSEYCEYNNGFYAEELAWNGIDIWGVASSNNEYHIHCGAELAFMSDLVNNGLNLKGYTIVLENDIDLNSNLFTPIGISATYPYRGSFEGDDFSIVEINVKTTNGLNALFGYVQPYNSHFSNCNIDGGLSTVGAYSYLSSLIAYVDISKDNLQINNISSCMDNKCFSGSSIGGIIGYIKSSGDSNIILSKCKNEGIVRGYSGWGQISGGIIGSCELTSSDNLSLYQCSNEGTVASTGKFQAGTAICGGLIGKAVNGSYKFHQCAVGGYLFGNCGEIYVSGIVASFSPVHFEISNCEIFANMKFEGIGMGYHLSGGLIADLKYDNRIDDSNYSVLNTYVSSVTNNNDGSFGLASGFISTWDSSNYPLTIKNSFFDRGKTTLSTEGLVKWSGILQGHNVVDDSQWVNTGFYDSAFLRSNKDLYKDWDTENIWTFAESGYPILRAFADIEPCASHVYSGSTTLPTCTAQGYTTFICDNCGYSYIDNYVSANGHTYEYTKTVLPTCAAQGYDLYTCTVCGATEKRNYVNANGHNNVLTNTVLSTCNTAGYYEYTCSVCGNISKEEIAVLDGGALTTALENAQAKLAKNCFTLESYINLQMIYNKHEDSLDTYTSQSDVDNAVTEINTAISELIVGDTASGVIDDGFSWTWSRETGELIITGEGTMSSYGSTSMPWYEVLPLTTSVIVEEGITSIGSYAFYDAINIKNISLPSTLTTINAYAFKNCTSIEELVVPNSVTNIGYAAFSNLTSLKKVSVPASTTYRSYAFENDLNVEEIIITCGTDGEIHDSNYTTEQSVILDLLFKRTGNFGPWKYADNAVVTISEGVTSIGAKTFYNCAGISEISIPESVTSISSEAFYNCDMLESIELSKNVEYIGDYAFSECDNLQKITVLNPNCTFSDSSIVGYMDIKGYRNSTAQAYAEANSMNFIPIEAPDTLKISTVSLSLESSITMNFKVLKTDLADFENPYVVFTCEGDELTVTEYKEQGEYYVFSYPGISPQLMNDEVNAVLYATYSNDGEVYNSPAKVMSVRKYAYTLLERYGTSDYAKLRTLLVDLLNYGAAAQKYVGYQTEELVNADLTDEQRSWGTNDELEFENIRDNHYTTIDSPESEWLGSGLVLNNSLTIRAKFSADDIKNKTVVITCGNGEFTYSKDDFVKAEDGNYYVYCDELFANEMSKEILLTVYDNGIQCSDTMRFSIESYAKLVHDSYAGTALDDLTTAMMRYGRSAEAYGS